MRRSALAIVGLLLRFAPAASADVSFSPLLPTAADRVTIVIDGGWGDGCVPRDPETVVAGRQITVTLNADKSGGCTLSPVSFREIVRVDDLEPGVYEIVVRIGEDGTTSIFDTRQLIVAEVDPAFVVLPAVVPTEGGEVVIISTSYERPLTTCGPNSCDPVPVFFGETRVVATDASNERLRVTAPPHISGVVDVTVGEGPGRLVARAALRYAAGDEEPDRQSFATVLVPLVYNGPGAYGSQWRTDIHLRNNSVVLIRPARDAGDFCPEAPPISDPAPECESHVPPATTVMLRAENHPRGLLLHLPRTLADAVAFSAVVRDVSRSHATLGTELPIVREDDFRSDTIDFLDIPFGDPRYRITLRVYALNTDYAYLSYVITRPGGVVASNGVTARRYAIDEPAFASIELPPMTESIDVPTRLQLRSPFLDSFWAFLSITNNETQQVTIVRPQ